MFFWNSYINMYICICIYIYIFDYIYQKNWNYYQYWTQARLPSSHVLIKLIQDVLMAPALIIALIIDLWFLQVLIDGQVHAQAVQLDKANGTHHWPLNLPPHDGCPKKKWSVVCTICIANSTHHWPFLFPPDDAFFFKVIYTIMTLDIANNCLYKLRCSSALQAWITAALSCSNHLLINDALCPMVHSSCCQPHWKAGWILSHAP